MNPRPYLLCGGESRRMGRDKAMMAHPEGGSLLARACRLLVEAVGPPALLSGKGLRYGETGLPRVEDLRENCGPLAGIEAALENSSPDPALLLAVDMPFVTGDDLRSLLAARGPGVTLAVSGSRRHPALSIWDASTLPAVKEALDSGRFTLMALLEKLPVREVEMPADHLANWNGPPESRGPERDGESRSDP